MAKCKACGAEIKWVNVASGKAMPCNVKPLTVVVPKTGEVVRAYESHFPTCPEADKFRNKKKRGGELKMPKDTPTQVKMYGDCGLDDHWIVRKVQAENKWQIATWGKQKHTAFEWLALATGGLGYLSEAIREYEHDGCYNKEDIIEEAVQLATLALKIAYMFEVSE